MKSQYGQVSMFFLPSLSRIGSPWMYPFEGGNVLSFAEFRCAGPRSATTKQKIIMTVIKLSSRRTISSISNRFKMLVHHHHHFINKEKFRRLNRESTVRDKHMIEESNIRLTLQILMVVHMFTFVEQLHAPIQVIDNHPIHPCFFETTFLRASLFGQCQCFNMGAISPGKGSSTTQVHDLTLLLCGCVCWFLRFFPIFETSHNSKWWNNTHFVIVELFLVMVATNSFEFIRGSDNAVSVLQIQRNVRRVWRWIARNTQPTDIALQDTIISQVYLTANSSLTRDFQKSATFQCPLPILEMIYYSSNIKRWTWEKCGTVWISHKPWLVEEERCRSKNHTK